MPKKDVPSDLDEAASKIEIAKEAIDRAEKEFDRERPKHAKAHVALWDCKDTIDQCQKGLKKESNTKKIQELAEKITESENTCKSEKPTWESTKEKLGLIGGAARDAHRVLQDQDKELDKIEKDMTRSGAEKSDFDAWDKTIKGLRKFITADGTRAFNVLDEVKNLPAPPKL